MTMAFEQKSLDDYVDVAERIADFRAAWPEGSLRPWNPAEPWRIVQAEGTDKNGEHVMQSFLVVVAAAYRHGLDDNPGVGMAWEIFPGRTPYTRGSELQNAETSAWGRAIIAVGASDSKRGIASREEVRNRQAEREPDDAARLIEEARALRRLPPEVDGDGAATQAEMTRAMTGPEPGTVRLSTTPVDDEFYVPPQGEPVLPEDAPGSSSNSQRMSLALALSEAGFTTPEAGRAECSRIVGREIKTRRELSFVEAERILAVHPKRGKLEARR